MHLYTFIMEFKGGTYISQVKATSPQLACMKWANHLKVSEVHGLGQTGHLALIKEMQEEEPIKIQDAKGAWCISARIRGHLALVNLVRTACSDDD
jgi:hypothetical protein